MKNAAIVTASPLELEEVRTSTARRMILAAVIVGVTFVAGGMWAGLAPLNSAAIAPGVVGADTRNKTVQHLEGGIIREILVTEGSVVDSGQALLRLDDTRANATLQLIQGQLRAASALEARLLAEHDGSRNVEYPAWLVAQRGDPEVAKIVSGQDALFEARRASLEGDIAITRQKIAQFEDEITGLHAQRVADEAQIGLLNEEISVVATLVANGQERRPRLLALQRHQKQLEGDRGQSIALIARARQNIGEAQLRISQLGAQRLNEVVEDLRKTQALVFDLQERRRAAEDVHRRLVLRAPNAGTVVRLGHHTVGAVIQPGEPILDLVPSDDLLLIEARIRPDDIDVVMTGMPAEVRLTAFNQRRLPILLGTVTYVSADRLIERTTEQAYYLARIKVEPDSIASLPTAKLYPGMPAEVLVQTGARTVWDYIATPIASSMRRAFRED